MRWFPVLPWRRRVLSRLDKVEALANTTRRRMNLAVARADEQAEKQLDHAATIRAIDDRLAATAGCQTEHARSCFAARQQAEERFSRVEEHLGSIEDRAETADRNCADALTFCDAARSRIKELAGLLLLLQKDRDQLAVAADSLRVLFAAQAKTNRDVMEAAAQLTEHALCVNRLVETEEKEAASSLVAAPLPNAEALRRNGSILPGEAERARRAASRLARACDRLCDDGAPTPCDPSPADDAAADDPLVLAASRALAELREWVEAAMEEEEKRDGDTR